tara:strand:- start:258 stop:575 length:318 start_codon:yes stop_codon:yes gene_type:complete
MTNKTEIRHYHLIYGDEGYLPLGNEIIDKDEDINSVVTDEINKIQYWTIYRQSDIETEVIKDIFTSKDDYSDGVKITFNRDTVGFEYMEITPCILSEELCPNDED